MKAKDKPKEKDRSESPLSSRSSSPEVKKRKGGKKEHKKSRRN